MVHVMVFFFYTKTYEMNMMENFIADHITVTMTFTESHAIACNIVEPVVIFWIMIRNTHIHRKPFNRKIENIMEPLIRIDVMHYILPGNAILSIKGSTSSVALMKPESR